MRLRKVTAALRGLSQRPPKRPRVRPPRLHQPTVHLTAMMAGACVVAAFAAASPALHGSVVGTNTPSQPVAVVGQADGGGVAPAAGPGTGTTYVTPPSTTVTAGPGTVATVLYNAQSGAVEAASPLAADGIPVTALEAYQNAASTINAADPNCHLPWPLLAGIGRVESDHGRYGGAVLRPDGTSTKPIIGPPLDGNGTEVVTDTDNGRIDGDPVYDRAVGPMQFIPSTWAVYGTDGNSDGIADPFNIFDAAAAAAHYLCVAGGDLATTAGQVRAVLSYNHSTAYLVEVLALEHTYASGDPSLIIPAAPVTTPTLPVAQPGKPVPPPVNPGPPLSAGTGSGPGTGASSSTSAHPSPTTTTPQPSSPSAPTSTSTSATAPGGSTTAPGGSATAPGGSATAPGGSDTTTSSSTPSGPTGSSSPACPSSSTSASDTTSNTGTPADTPAATVDTATDAATRASMNPAGTTSVDATVNTAVTTTDTATGSGTSTGSAAPSCN